MLSPYQVTVINNMSNGEGHTAVNAVAGSGKTFTICEGVKQMKGEILVAAFGKDIQLELEKRNLPSNCEVRTYNAFGWKICRENARCQLFLVKNKTEKLLEVYIPGDDEESFNRRNRLRYPVKRLVSILKGGIITQPEGLIDQLVTEFDMELPDDEPDFNTVVCDIYKQSINHRNWFDFDDQIFQVHYRNYLVPEKDAVIVDEMQDTNFMQLELMRKVGGRFFGVGDPYQAIYGFRGATPKAFEFFKERFRATELPLSVSYRCPLSVIKEAKKIVPHIEPAPGAIEGCVDSVEAFQFEGLVKPGDMVLCRTIAPLVKSCLKHIRHGVPARIYGRDLGGDLEFLIQRVGGNELMSVNMFESKLNEYYVEKQEKWAKRPGLLARLDDQVQTLEALMEDSFSVADIFKKIEWLFTDKPGLAIMYMSIHKSKGLENKNVFILRPDLIPHPRAKLAHHLEEERRIYYVAVTRSKENLFFVNRERT